jgi:hypothetical protein
LSIIYAARFLWTNVDTDTARTRWGLSPSTLQDMQRMQRSPEGRPFERGLGWVLRQEKGEEILEPGAGDPASTRSCGCTPSAGWESWSWGNINDHGVARILSASADIF